MPATGKEAVSLNQAKTMYWKIRNDLTDQMDNKIGRAVAAEASAREKADQLLETEVDGKLDAADLIAGANVTITPDPESGHVTIAANVPDTSAFVTKTAADAAYQPKGSYADASHTHPGSQITGFPASRAIASDASGNLAASAVTSTELGYLDGVTSGIQAQLDDKAAASHTHTVSQITDFPEIPEINLATDAEAKGFLGY